MHYKTMLFQLFTDHVDENWYESSKKEEENIYTSENNERNDSAIRLGIIQLS